MSTDRACRPDARRKLAGHLRHALAVALIWLAGVAPAAAQGSRPNYLIDIDAPSELLVPLRTQTLLGRWRNDPNFETIQLRLFIERMRDEALAIAQAAGYFSARVEVSQAPARVPRLLGSGRAPARGEPQAVEPEPSEGPGSSGELTSGGAVSGTPGVEGGETQDADERKVPVVRVLVDAGARTTVNLMQLEVLGEAGQDPKVQKQLLDDWPLPEGSFFQTSQWDIGKRRMLEQLQQLGYLRAKVARSRASVDPELTAASLSVSIDSGPRLRYGDARIQGAKRYPQSIIEALMPWDRGDLYTFDALQTLQERLRADGHYTSATILPDLEAVERDAAREDVPIDIKVRERRAQRVTFGLGYSTDKGPRGLAGYDRFDMFGRGWIADTGVQAESVQYLAFANLRTPTDRDAHYFRGGVRRERLDVQGELTDANTMYVGRGKHDDAIEHFIALQFQSENRSVDAQGSNITGSASALGLSYAWTLRRVDSTIDPRNGYALNGQVTGGFTGMSVDRTFVRLYGRAVHFLSMPEQTPFEGGLLISRLEAGWVGVDSRDDIPSENLFRTGGSNTVRGYEYLGLGIREGSAVVGGRVLGVASLEYQHPIKDAWAGAVFVDVGNAADSWSGFRVATGTGVGLRWRSPVGPINVDVAYGDEAHRWRFHMSVGYTF